jgi:ankyrin repeat protein
VERGITPLMYAGLDVSDQAASLLKTRGADPTLRDWKNRTADDYRRLAADWRARPQSGSVP